MNVLLFVTTMLIVLSLMTYVRIESYRYSSGLKSQFERYMQTIERHYINQTASKWYDTTIANTRGAKPNDPKQKSKASSRLSLAFLIDQEQNNDSSKAQAQTLQWAKNLLEVLYGQSHFYQEAKQKDPALNDRLFDAIIKAVRELDPDLRPKNTADLTTLALADPGLENVFYLMMKGCPSLEEAAATEVQAVVPQFLTDADVDENDDAEEALEYRDAKSYSSLLNYITLNKASGLRIYLASKPVLTAVFGDPHIADNIISARTQLYSSIIQGLAPDEATKQFQNMFHSAYHGSDSSLLDFKVTKTNPSKYN